MKVEKWKNDTMLARDNGAVYMHCANVGIVSYYNCCI